MHIHELTNTRMQSHVCVCVYCSRTTLFFGFLRVKILYAYLSVSILLLFFCSLLLVLFNSRFLPSIHSIFNGLRFLPWTTILIFVFMKWSSAHILVIFFEFFICFEHSHNIWMKNDCSIWNRFDFCFNRKSIETNENSIEQIFRPQTKIKRYTKETEVISMCVGIDNIHM